MASEESAQEEGTTDRWEEDEVAPPQVLSGPEPAYPESVLGTGFTGETVVKVVIDTDGTTRTPRLLSSSGVTAADVAVLLVLERWRFRPATLNGRPVAACYTLTTRFTPR